MSGRDFLRRLSREHKLELVELSDEVKLSYLRKPESHLPHTLSAL
jgi:hypothetical protein